MAATFDPIVENRLMNFLHQHFGFEVFTPGLKRTEVIFRPFVASLQSTGAKVITVAGTNGKGQTAHSLAWLFLESGKSVALWTSPHILTIRERFCFDGVDVSYEELENEMIEAQKIVSGISFYEFLFFVFLRLSLKRKTIDYLILEVGLGGRLDAVNHFDADCAAITSISRDHQAILGHSLREILAEKIAIGRIGRPLFTAFSLEYLNEMTHKYSLKNNINWISLPPEKDYYTSNVRMAEQIFHYFIPMGAVEKNQSRMPFKGRHEEMTFRGNTLIFIGAHNVEGMRKMLEHFSLKKVLQENSVSLDAILFSFSKRPKKEIEVMLQMLTDFSKNVTELWPTFFTHPKAIDRDVIEKNAEEFITDWRDKLESYSESNQNKKILVCGSYYFIGEVQRFILNH